MALAPTATAIVQPAGGSPGPDGLPSLFLANVTFNTAAGLASQEAWATQLVGVANGLPAGTRILGTVGFGGTAVVDAGGVGLLMSIRDANLEFRSNATNALTAPAATVGIVHTFLCARQ